MFYNFPKIKTIEDVLPAVEDRKEFVVAERDFGTVINYNVQMTDTFNIDEDDLMSNYGRAIPKGIMRRECRGLIFGLDGKIMSRPFHKFFNIGEREETQFAAIDMSRDHVVMEKMDGCLAEETLILCSDQLYRTIKDVIEYEHDVMGVDEQGNAVTANYIDGLITESDKEWVEIVTEAGSIYCTEDHKFLTEDGYVEAKDLLGRDLKEVC